MIKLKAKIISLLLVFLLLSFSISGCSDSEAANNRAPSDNSVLKAYRAVLQGEAAFYSTDNIRTLYLNDFLTNKELYEVDFKVSHFAVLDMDGDNIPEAVLELSVGEEPQFYEVLHYMNDKIYGYLIVYRGLEGLKTDGTFIFSSGAADNGFGKLKFEADALNTDILGYSKSEQADTGLTISYFINNKKVTKESYDSFYKEQFKKEAAAWYEFTQENIEAEL